MNDEIDSKLSGSSLQWQGQSCMDSDPDRAAALLKQAIDAYAHEKNERGELSATHWLLQTFNCFSSRYSEALDIGVRAVVKARKPEYSDFQTRICLHEDLISSYLGIDPEGYETEIRNLLEYMRGEVSENQNCAYCLRYRSFDLEFWLENFEAAHQIALSSLAKTNDGYIGQWYRVGYLGELCALAIHSPLERENVAEYATEAEAISRRQDRTANYAPYAMFRAFGYRLLGDEKEAKKHFRRAQNVAKTHGLVRVESFYGGMRAFYALEEDFVKVAALCDEELGLLQEKGASARIARVHRYKCEALQKAGALDSESLELAKVEAAKLRQPQNELRRLMKLSVS